MDANENKFENYSNFNRDKRLKLVQNFSNLTKSNLENEADFEQYVKQIKFPLFDDNDNLIETLIRYSILYLEEFNYELKLQGLDLLDHLVMNTSPSVLNLNMRSKLIFTTYERYMNDKDGSLIFLEQQIQSMLKLLNVIESKQSSSEHNYIKHSLILDSLLNNCYMTTNIDTKTVYYKNLNDYVKQSNDYSCRHLEKLLTVAFDCGLDNSKISFDFVSNEKLLDKSLDLTESIIDVCAFRIHWHANRVINFLLKLIYFACLKDLETNRLISMLQKLLSRNRLVSQQKELDELKLNKSLNLNFLKIIQQI